jgi:hypothetical protein
MKGNGLAFLLRSGYQDRWPVPHSFKLRSSTTMDSTRGYKGQGLDRNVEPSHFRPGRVVYSKIEQGVGAEGAHTKVAGAGITTATRSVLFVSGYHPHSYSDLTVRTEHRDQTAALGIRGPIRLFLAAHYCRMESTLRRRNPNGYLRSRQLSRS